MFLQFSQCYIYIYNFQYIQIMQTELTKYQLLSSQTKTKSINQLIQSHKYPHQNLLPLKTIKIMYSHSLCSIEGIHYFQNVQILNLNSNKIRSLEPLSKLSKIKQLSISSNQLENLAGIENCVMLVKINLANNYIERLGCLQKLRENGNNCLMEVDLSNNRIQECRELSCFAGYGSLRSVYFQKKNATNVICIKNKLQYYKAIYNYIIKSNGNSVVVDDKTANQIIKIINNFNKGQENNSYQEENMNSQNYGYENSHNHQHTTYSEQQQYNPHKHFRKQPTTYTQKPSHNKKIPSYNPQLQTILQHKEQILQQLKAKLAALQIKNSQQYKELIKKESQTQRLYGQVSELSKQVENKELKVSEYHKRIEKLLESITEANRDIEHKNKEMENMGRNINQLKIQNAEYRTLAKSYEKKMNQFHQKAFDAAEDRAVRTQELKRENKELYEQNMSMATDINSLKDRNRELTELLREWDYKYQNKVSEIYKDYQDEKQLILQQAQKKLNTQEAIHEDQINSLSNSLNQQLKSMQGEYQKALDEALTKYKIVKMQLDERKEQERELKLYQKQLSHKEQIIGQLQSALRALKREYQNILKDKERVSKQLHSFRMSRQDQFRKLSQQYSRLSYEKNSLEKSAMDLKQNNTNLQLEIDRYVQKEKQYEEIELKNQDLQTRITTQQHMLDDKNDTIEDLKAEIQILKQELENRNNQQKQSKYNHLRNKYDKLKRQKQQLLQANQILQQQKQLLQQQKQAQQIQLQENKSALDHIDTELKQFQGIIKQQQQQITTKDNTINSLITTLQQCKNDQNIKIKEIEQFRRETQRLEIQLRRVRDHWERNQREIQRKHRLKIQELENRRKQEVEEKAREFKKSFEAMANNLFKIN